jgi:hypothetical protein
MNTVIALEKQQSIFTDGNAGNMYATGQRIGELTKNLNNGTLLINGNEIVKIEKVAILLNQNETIVDTKSNYVVPKPTTAMSSDKVKKIVALAVLGVGIYLLYKGKIALGIGVGIAGLVLTKKNFQNGEVRQ